MKQKRHLERGEIREGKGLAGGPCRQQRWPECQCPSKLDLGVVQGLANSPTLTFTPWLPLPLVESQNAEEDEPLGNPHHNPRLLSGTRCREHFIIIPFYR